MAEFPILIVFTQRDEGTDFDEILCCCYTEVVCVI